jgi:DNA-binding response OmpR family regulator
MLTGLTRSTRILFVEDHFDTFDLVAAFLRDSIVVNAPTASDGLREAMEQCFDLHLIDQHLPDTAGSTLCQVIRKFDADTPILLCSEDTGLTNADAISVGANGILRKGINFLEDLAERLFRV